MDTTQNSGYVVTSNDCMNLIPEPGQIIECMIVSSLIGAETTKEKKQNALDLLELIPDLGNNKANDKLAKAIEHVENSLEPELWVDDEYLDDKDGKIVFHEEEKAVKQLLKIQKESDTCTGITEMSLKYIGIIPDVYINVLGFTDTQVPLSTTPIPFGMSVVFGDGETAFSSDTDVEISWKDADDILHVMEDFTIHTSCSTPIAVHDIHGDLTMHPDFVPVVPVILPLGSVEIDGLSVLDDGNGGTIDPNILGDLLSIAYTFVAIDRQLKDTTLLQAQGYSPGDGKYYKEMEKAMKETDKGDDKRDDGKLAKAIHHYEKAWEHAQKAIKEAT